MNRAKFFASSAIGAADDFPSFSGPMLSRTDYERSTE